MKNAFVLVLFVAAITLGASAQTQVFVPGTALGYFGNPLDQPTPFVSAITVTGPATITVTYVSGQACWGGPSNCVGPNGGFYRNSAGLQFPLQEAKGVATPKKIQNISALIGVFVPAARVNRTGFQAVDGTKNVAKVGIMPGSLFFIGEGKTFSVNQAGTLYLGINDVYAGDDSGGFTVEVSSQQLRTRR